jgi:hypothetical protein
MMADSIRLPPYAEQKISTKGSLMRVACLYLPSFALQVHVRCAPHLAGTAFAVAAASPRSRGAPRLIAVSRAASDAGVRVGMPVAQAISIVTNLQVVAADPEASRAALCAIAESLLVWSPVVDLGSEDEGADPADAPAHRALFVQVPAGARGATFGEKLLAAANRQGMRARVGIADDRFTAWTAAAIVRSGAGAATEATLALGTDGSAQPFAQTCVSVPRGGSAAFLAPLPLWLLPMGQEVRHLLETLAVRTLGDFAALPPPTVDRRWSDSGVDLHQLARGDGPVGLSGFQPSGPITERLHLDADSGDPDAASFLLRPVLDRIGERLRGRRRAAAALIIRVRQAGGSALVLALPLTSPTASGRRLLEAVRAGLRRRDTEGAGTSNSAPFEAIEIQVTAESEPDADELELFAGRTHRRTRRGKHRLRHARQPALPLA